MTHIDADRLSRYLDAELRLPESREVELHVRECDRCSNELRHLRVASSALATLGSVVHPVPAATEARILSSVEHRRRGTRRRAVHKFSPMALGTTMAAILVLLGANLGTLLHPAGTVPTSAWSTLPSNVRQQAALLQRSRSRSAILGVQVSSPDATQGRRLRLLDVE